MLNKSILLGCFLVFSGSVMAQQSIALDDFEDPGKSWEEVGAITVNPLDGTHETVKGEGIFVNLPTKRRAGEDIRTTGEYGDIDLAFEYMMFPGSNSGVYLQGRYEIQLLDSWKKEYVTSGDNGGIYERWIEDKQEGYEGHAPRQNASLAPGLWQKMEISFQAPRYDDGGNKVENAKILSIRLNGVLIHENVELSGPTRGSWGDEAPKGPIRIQGDHGAVAFRNMTITTFENSLPELSGLTYEVYKGLVTEAPDFTKMDPVATGETDLITPAVSSVEGPFLIRFQGNLEVPVAGEYEFGAMMNGGGGILRIDDNQVIGPAEWGGNGKVSLEAGTHELEFLYAKLYDWAATGVGLAVQGPGIRWTSFYDENMNMGTTVDPIYVDAPAIHRSFVDIGDGYRLTRAVSVGSKGGLHYTYDMDHGALVQGWHGEFMDATPMWHDRGDGSADPRGAVTMIDGAQLIIGNQSFQSDTTGTGFRPRGYTLENPVTPIFHYDIYGGSVSDKIVPGNGSFMRTISTEGLNNALRIALGKGKSITEVDKGLYSVDGKYFIRTNAETTIQAAEESQVLTAPLQREIQYEIIF